MRQQRGKSIYRFGLNKNRSRFWNQRPNAEWTNDIYRNDDSGSESCRLERKPNRRWLQLDLLHLYILQINILHQINVQITQFITDRRNKCMLHLTEENHRRRKKSNIQREEQQRSSENYKTSQFRGKLAARQQKQDHLSSRWRTDAAFRSYGKRRDIDFPLNIYMIWSRLFLDFVVLQVKMLKRKQTVIKSKDVKHYFKHESQEKCANTIPARLILKQSLQTEIFLSRN